MVPDPLLDHEPPFVFHNCLAFPFEYLGRIRVVRANGRHACLSMLGSILESLMSVYEKLFFLRDPVLVVLCFQMFGRC